MNSLRHHWTDLAPSTRRFIAVLFLLGLIVRIIYIFSIDLIPKDYLGIDMDAVEYDYLGLNIAEGRGVVDRFGDPTALRFPAYLYFLGLIYFLFGHHHLVVLLFQALIGALPPLLIYFTARQLLPERPSRLAGVIAAGYPGFIYYVGWLMTENLFLLLLNLLLFLTVSLKDTASWRKIILMGVLVGLLGLTRGVGLPFIFILPVYVFLRLKEAFRMRWIRAVVLMVVGILMLVPWTIRNYHAYHRWMLPSSEGGVVLWMGFNQLPLLLYEHDEAFAYVDSVGRDNARSEEFYRLLRENNYFGLTGMKRLFELYYPDEPPPQSEPEASERLAQKTMALLKEHPMLWVVKSIKQVFRFWHVLDERGRYVWGYAFVIPFFLVGAWKLRRRLRDFFPLYLYMLVLYGVAVVFFADARFRMPFEGVFIIPAAFAMDQFLQRFQRCYAGYAVLILWFAVNYFLRLNSLQVRLAIRAVAGALGFPLAEMD